MVGGGALLSGHLTPVPDAPLPLDPASGGLPGVSATPTPPPVPAESARSPRLSQSPQPPRSPDEAGETGETEPGRRFLPANGRRQPPRMRVPASASGRYAVVGGEARPPARRGKGKVIRYLVEVERGLPFDAREFADEVHRILNDRRGWGPRFHRVGRGPAEIRVSLSSPAMTDRQCRPLITFGALSCWNHGRAVVNAMRWNAGVRGYGRDVASYREYVVSHEVGHGLGHGHVSCPGSGRRAPVMLQQTKSLYGCRPNPWPSPRAGAQLTLAKRLAQ